MKTDVFLGGESIDKAADGVEFPGNVLGAPLLRALEEHVFNKMSDPSLFLLLIARSHFHPDAR